MTTAEASPLSGTLARLRQLDERLDATVGRPAGQAWYAVSHLGGDGQLDAWLREAEDGTGGQKDVAGAYLGSWLAGAVATIAVTTLVLERRVPELGGMWVHRHREGWFDRVAFLTGRVLVLAEDPDADHPDAEVVNGLAALHDRLAEALVATLTPLLQGVRQRSPFGRRGLWGQVADRVTGTALSAARLAGTDGWAAWDEAVAVLDLAAAREPDLRARPIPAPVTWSGGTVLFQVRGTCCLYYKTHQGPLDACGDGYCTTCPFRDGEDRLARLRHHLEHPPTG